MVEKGVNDKHFAQYEVLKLLAQGGMGEVFLAKDLTCGRLVALKKIKEELLTNETIAKRFLNEAHLTAKLTHPSIIPIYAIHREGKHLYYTMPYVEGKTLREVLKETKKLESAGKTHPIGSSIPALIRIFLQVCEAIAYAHSQGILHRDIKPENIILGKFGEVLILDWGLIETHIPLKALKKGDARLTKPGKVAGTLAFLAPERARGAQASPSTDLYALGCLLYQLLTLKLPFYRTTLSKFVKAMHHERLHRPQEIAPYRDIPDPLASIALQCLHPSSEKRPKSVAHIIEELKHFIEGRFEWVVTTHLHPLSKGDWEFQENVLLAKHTALSKEIDVMEWVYLMVSKVGFTGNTKLSLKVKIHPECKGVGVLLCIPEAKERKSIEEGYLLWIANEEKGPTTLFRSNVEVLEADEARLTPNRWHHLEIEKVGNNLTFFLDGSVAFKYLSHLPLTGSHIGLLLKDTAFEITHLTVLNASHNAHINCLSVPDAFFSAKNYPKALEEYRKIGTSFSGRTEGREALFRVGITLMEQGRAAKSKKGARPFFQSALDAFSELHNTSAAPLEYFGKALVYREIGDVEEEVKCLELSLRKFPQHPLLPPLIEEIVYRLHETSGTNRLKAHHFALLALRFLPYIFERKDHKRLIDKLFAHLEPLPFFVPSERAPLITLAFYLNKPRTLLEIADEEASSEGDRFNVGSALLSLGCRRLIPQGETSFPPFCQEWLSAPVGSPSRCLLYTHLREQIDKGHIPSVLADLLKIDVQDDSFALLYIEALLYQKNVLGAAQLLAHKSVDENSPFFTAYAAYLALAKGKEAALAHLGTIDIASSALQRSTLLPLFFKKRVAQKDLFFFEELELLRQKRLFSHCTAEEKDAKLYAHALKKALEKNGR